MTTTHAPPRPPPVLGRLFRPVGDGPFSPGRRVAAFAVAAVLLGGVVAVDHRLAHAVYLGPLYLLPVVLAVWLGGRWPGYLTAAASAVAWVVLPRPGVRSNETVGLIIAAIALRLVIYPAMIELVCLLQAAERRLRRAVDERTAELQQEVAERQRAQDALRRLAAQLSAAEDAERRRVAHDIHDALSQTLGVVKLNLQTIVAGTPAECRPDDRLADVVGIVDSLIGQTRDLTFDLHPSMLDHFGLVPTLAEFAAQFARRTGVDLTVTAVGPPPAPPPPLAVASYLFRAAKELVSNAVRHGRAREVVVTVHWPTADSPRVRVVVDDDGGGFDPAVATAPHARRGLGLAGIAERLAGLGGRLRLESEPGRGSRAVLEVPAAAGSGPPT